MTLTNFRFVFVPNEPNLSPTQKWKAAFLEIPLGLIEKIEASQDKKKTQSFLDVYTKDNRWLRFVGENFDSTHNLKFFIEQFAFPKYSTVETPYIFAFEYKDEYPKTGWDVYSDSGM